MDSSYVKLIIAALAPVVMAVILYLLVSRTKFGKSKRWVQNLIIGVIFGGLAILGTEWGIPMNGAQVNCRDAAVLIAGLFFSAPAGIIAGLIGGVERWIAVAWGVGTFTRVACSISTIIAGFYAALLRKFMFEDKKPGGLILPLGIGIVMETFHLTMVFITNMAMPEKAMAVVKACSIPMIAANGVSVMIAAFVLVLLSREKNRKRNSANISQTIQRWLMITVVLAFAVTSFFVFRLQNELADSQVNTQLSQAISEVESEVEEASDKGITELAKAIAEDYKFKRLKTIAEEYAVAEISIVN